MSDKCLLVVGGAESLAGELRRLAQHSQHGWSVERCDSGQGAYATLDTKRIAAIVAHDRLPDVQTLAFLEQVRKTHPNVARLVNAPSTAPEAVMLSMKVAHAASQVGVGHKGVSELLDAVERTSRVQHRIHSDQVRSVTNGLDRLPAVPSTYFELVRLAGRSDVSVQDVSNVIERDPVMCVKILQLVNSAFFGMTRRVAAIQQAVSMLGIDLLKGMVLSAHVFATFEAQKAGGFSLELFQKYSIGVARLAKAIAPQNRSTEAVFTTGLVHDIGKMILAIRFPEKFAAINQCVAETGAAVQEVERAYLGTTHSEVGAAMLDMWGLPWPVIEAVAYHHCPFELSAGLTGDFSLLAAIHAADALKGIYTCGEPVERLDTRFLETVGFGDQVSQWHALAKSATHSV